MECTILQEDINQKLDTCFFRYKGKAYYTREDGMGGGMLKLYAPSDIRGKFVHKIHFRDPDFDISSIPTGYINGDTKVWSLFRYPVRKVKQGLCDINTYVCGIEGSMKLGRSGFEFMCTKGFEEMAEGVYPTPQEALETLRGRPISSSGKLTHEIAVSRDCALQIDRIGLIKVFFKQEYIGYVEPNKDIVNVLHPTLGWAVSLYLNSVFSSEKIV